MFLKNNVKLFLMGTLYFIVYLYLFYLGNYEAPDRMSYFEIFENPLSDKWYVVEPGMIYISSLFELIGLPVWFHFYFYASVISLSSMTATFLLLRNARSSFLYIYPLIFFAGLGILSFAQLRTAIAIWVGLLLYYFYLEHKKKWIWAGLALTVLFHKAMLPFVILGFAYHILRISLKWLLGATAIFMSVLTFFPEYIITALGFNEYYLVYFVRAKNNIFFSPLVLAYFGLTILSFFIFTKKDRKNYEFIYLALPTVVIGYVSSVDLYVKLMFPFIILTWIFVLKVFHEKLISKLQPVLSYGFQFGLLTLSIAYAAMRY